MQFVLCFLCFFAASSFFCSASMLAVRFSKLESLPNCAQIQSLSFVFAGMMVDIKSYACGPTNARRPETFNRTKGRIDMADYRERDQGLRGDTGGEMGRGQHAPGRNPQEDRSAGGQQKDIDYSGQKPGNLGRQQGIKRGNGRTYKEGGQYDQT